MLFNFLFQNSSSELSICTSTNCYPLLIQLTPRFDPFNSFSLLSTVSSDAGTSKSEDSVSPTGDFSTSKKFSESDDIMDDGSTVGTGSISFLIFYLH